MPDIRAYLTTHLDQLAAADRDLDEPAAARVLAAIINDDHPAARQAIADALRLHHANHDGRQNAAPEDPA